MFCIIDKNLIFRKDDSASNDLFVKASPYPQPIPEWVKDTLLFQWGINDGTIQVFEKPVQVAVEKEEVKEEPKVEIKQEIKSKK